MIVLAYFHPWTLRRADADEHVPVAGSLRPDANAWQDTLTALDASAPSAVLVTTHNRPQMRRDFTGGSFPAGNRYHVGSTSEGAGPGCRR